MHPLLLQLAQHGFAIVLGNVLLERLGLPIPALPTLIAAGALAAQGRLPVLGVLFLATSAALVADLGWFLLALALARIAPAELRSLLGSARPPLVVDVRTETALLVDPRRIPGALRMTLDEIGPRLDGLPRDRDIVLYCT